jgi:monovalent cation:H+ antiporter-2, CPA2 family
VEPEVVLIELGLVIVGLAVLARVAGALAIPTIPFYVFAGLAFGEGGLFPLVTTEEFIEVGAEMGLILLLFMLGLEYSAAELVSNLRDSKRATVLNIVANFSPGFAAGLLLGWGWLPAIFLGGATYSTSSGIFAKLMHELGRTGNRETPVVLALTVSEDLAMAIYLPVLAALLIGGTAVTGLLPAAIAIAAVISVLFLALKVEVGISRMLFSHSDETLLLTILGIAVLVAGFAEMLQISTAAGALLAGIVLSGPAAAGARQLLAPLRDLFAAIFFVFFGLQIDPAGIPPTLGAALALAGIGVITKFATGWWSAAWAGIGPRGRARAGTALIPRGEFSIVIAGLAVAAGVEPRLGPLAATYVLALAIAGSLLTRWSDRIMRFLETLRERRASEPEGM